MKKLLFPILVVAAMTASTVFGQASYRLQRGSDALEFSIIDDRTVEVAYLVGGKRDKPTIIMDSSIVTLNTFFSIDTVKNEIFLKAPLFFLRIRIDSSDVTFSTSADEELFYSRLIDITKRDLHAVIKKGHYYGLEDLSESLALDDRAHKIFAGDQGHAGGAFIWGPNGFALVADVDDGYASINSQTSVFEYSKDSSIRVNNVFYLITGTPKEIYNSFYRITGFPPIPPQWSLGFIHSKWGQDEKEVLEKVALYREKDIPVDVFALDFEWMDWGNEGGEFKWNNLTFPSASSGVFKDTLTRQGITLMGIRKPRIHVEHPQGIYAKSQGYILAGTIGGDYISKKLCGLIDYFNPAARQWYWDSFIKQQVNPYETGIVAYWNDEVSYTKSLLGMNMQRSQYDGQRAYNSKRVFSLNRNYFLGSIKYAYGLWSGDINTSFKELTRQPKHMLSSIALGAAWWSMDVGGFWGQQDSSADSSELFIRWMQMGAFVPFYRTHCIEGMNREPWSYGMLAEKVSTEFIRLRYTILPYLYSSFASLHFSGVPPIRPLVFDYPEDVMTHNESRAWLVGGSIIVAPITENRLRSATFYLPKGEWYDMWDGTIYQGQSIVTITKGLEKIPILIKAGAILPMRQYGRYTSDALVSTDRQFHIYPGGNDTMHLYDDDHSTYDYEKNKFSNTQFIHISADSQERIVVGETIGDLAPFDSKGLFVIHHSKRYPIQVTIDDVPIQKVSVDSAQSGQESCWAFDSLTSKVFIRVPSSLSKKVILVNMNEPTVRQSEDMDSLTVSISENPARSSVKLKIVSPKNVEALIECFDISGKRMLDFSSEISKGENLIPIEIGDLPAGSYFLTIDSPAGSVLIRLIKE